MDNDVIILVYSSKPNVATELKNIPNTKNINKAVASATDDAVRSRIGGPPAARLINTL